MLREFFEIVLYDLFPEFFRELYEKFLCSSPRLFFSLDYPGIHPEVKLGFPLKVSTSSNSEVRPAVHLEVLSGMVPEFPLSILPKAPPVTTGSFSRNTVESSSKNFRLIFSGSVPEIPLEILADFFL